MCEEVSMKVLYEQVAYQDTENGPVKFSESKYADEYSPYIVYVKLVRIEWYVILESYAKIDNEVLVDKKEVLTGMHNFEHIRKTIKRFDDLLDGHPLGYALMNESKTVEA